MTIQEFRQQYPQYNDLSNDQLVDAFHRKYYADMPKARVYEAMGVPFPKTKAPSYSPSQFAEDAANVGIGMAKGAYAVASPMLESAKQIKQGVAEVATPFLEGRIPDSTESVGGSLRSAMDGVGLASAPFTVPLAAVTTATDQIPVVGQPISQAIHKIGRAHV